jgi:hypothetical protein
MAAPKYLTLVGGIISRVVAVVVATADSIVATGADGKIDISFLPAGVGVDTKTVTTSEALAAGDFVNFHISSGIKARKADGSSAGKDADGFVLAAVGSAGSALVYLRGINNQVTGLTPGEDYFLSVTTPGGSQDAAPTANGQVSQRLGKALSATELMFQDGAPAIALVS